MAEVSELVRFQRELKEEELLIVSMLAKIDKQLHALQVEQLQLSNATNHSSPESPVETNQATKSVETSMDANVKTELNLNVPQNWQESEDEESD